jgi:hypothetical protein
MNGSNYILNSKVVPDEKHFRLQKLLEDTWARQDTPNTKCVYTDNTLKDTNLILNSWNTNYQNPKKLPPILVLQVIFRKIIFNNRIYGMQHNVFFAPWIENIKITKKQKMS